ncbi:hypothetical protein SAMN04487950_0939 [Halogranum rubrum]|uniref:Dockerin domain-containing protein n=1 Tax=Halogranum rubrum TaxID=553466 RepID=A0A1I4C3N3_9EURY|nr:dockerin type I domain-containing protein [Halogranum rubrum]SFK75688.1 hypothetical protein SAMN04487950_0939 [Halogranum rubrum]
MKHAIQKRLRKTTAALVALALVLSVLGPVGIVAAAPDVVVTHGTDSITANPGDEVQITATFVQTETNAPGMEPLLPDGWTVTSANAGDGWNYFAQQNAFLGGLSLSDSDGVTGTYTHTYTVQVPESAAPGEYVVTSEGSVIVPSTSERLVNSASTTITVEEEVVEPPNFEVSGLTPTDVTVTQGDLVDVSATIENTGDEEATQSVSFQVDGSVVASQDVTLAGGASTTVSFEDIDTSSLDAGSYTHGVYTDDDEQTATLTVEEPVTTTPANFEVSGLNPTDVTVTQGDLIDVGATVENTGDEEATQSVEFQVDGNVVASQDVTLAGGASTTVSFEDVDTSSLAPGSYTHGVYTDDDSQTATLTVEEEVVTGKSSDVSLSPTSSEVVVGNTETFDVVVENVDGGVGAYTATVSSDDPSVTITNVELLGNPSAQTSDVQISEDGSSVTINAALMNTADSGAVTIATIEVTTQAEGSAADGDDGSANLSLGVAALGDETGQSYTVSGTSGATVTVVSLGPIGNFQNPPNDLDGDGIYEDINGDGTFNIVDIQATFANLNDPVVTENVEKFDYNGDGKIDVVDVQALYNMLITG